MVSVKLSPAKSEEAKALREQFKVPGYPTMLFLNADGTELDRLMGFMTPAEFLTEISRIESGDTFAAALQKLDEDPANTQILERSVLGLIERYDISAAYERIDAYAVAGPDVDAVMADRLLLKAMTTEHSILYSRAGRQYRNEWQDEVDLEGSRSTPQLQALLESDIAEEDRETQASLLRSARTDDASAILSRLGHAGIPKEELFDAASFAYRNGHYDIAGELYSTWYEKIGADCSSGKLNAAAWNLFLSRTSLESAVSMARQAFAEDSGPGVADTLAQLLYVTGATDEAIEIESKAATESEGESAEAFLRVVEIMKAGGDLEDKADFETYPEG
jgi:tetratricopeptide (TPR) repeat protein